MTVSYVDAIADVKARVAASRTSFHAGMMALSRVRREAMYALYAFCREVDDIADDSPSVEASARGLEKWRERIHSLFQKGITEDSISAALLPSIRRFDLHEEDFQAIIEGMAMDAKAPIVAPDTKTLDLYCDRVASAVGRVSVRIFGDASPEAMQVAHHLGRAFQLTNILRDLHEDTLRGRLYLPEELLTKHGLSSRLPKDVLQDTRLPLVCRDVANQAEMHFQAADAAMQLCLPGAMRPARIMRGYYGAILKTLVANNWRNPSERVCLPKWRKTWLALRYWMM